MAYMYCPDSSVDAVTGQCSSPVWVAGSPGGLPPLTGSQGAAISAAILACWGLGYVGRLFRYALRGRTA